MKWRWFFILATVCGVWALLFGIQSFSAERTAEADLVSPLEQRISLMSVDEKIGQMLMVSIPGTSLATSTAQWLRDHHVGGIILLGTNVRSARQTKRFIKQLKDNAARAGDPILFTGVDQEGGAVSRFLFLRERTAQKDVVDAQTAFRIGLARGKELRDLGVTINFSPVLDVSTSSRDFMFSRTFRGDAGRVAELGEAMIRGYGQAGIISVGKHFPGHGDTLVDSHKKLPVKNKTYAELTDDLWPFQKAIRAHVPMMMIGHIKFPLVDGTYPASMSPVIAGSILRGDLGYTGVVVTDDLGMGALMRTYDVAGAGVQAVKAGADILLVVRSFPEYDRLYTGLKVAVEHGEISRQRLDESVRRIASLKEKFEIQSAEPRNR